MKNKNQKEDLYLLSYIRIDNAEAFGEGFPTLKEFSLDYDAVRAYIADKASAFSIKRKFESESTVEWFIFFAVLISSAVVTPSMSFVRGFVIGFVLSAALFLLCKVIVNAITKYRFNRMKNDSIEKYLSALNKWLSNNN
jgi:hypothetical protein